MEIGTEDVAWEWEVYSFLLEKFLSAFLAKQDKLSQKVFVWKSPFSRLHLKDILAG